MTTELVTVITPAYNQGAYLAETIDSVLNQDYPELEYIVLDDGSSDNTPDVLAAYDDPRLRYECHDNMGEAQTVNKGFGMAHGDFVMIVNADDPLLPGAIRSQVDYMRVHPAVLATYPDWQEIDERSQPVKTIHVWDYDYALMIRRAACVPGPAALIRKRGIDQIEGRRGEFRYVTDMDFWFRLGLHGPLAHIPQTLATHRTHPDASGVARAALVGQEIVAYMRTFFDRDDLPPDIALLKNEAMSSAHAQAAARAPSYRERRHHYIQSFRLYPLNWIRNPDCRGLWKVGALLLPEPVYNMLRLPLRPVGKWLRARGQSRNEEK
jgi:glycosyltransferase involved in cell wall biosynthesis